MTEEIVLNVKRRNVSTKGELNKLRREGFVPGVFYYKDVEGAQYFYLPFSSLKPLVYTTETHMVKLQFDDGAEYQAVMKEVQFDPVSEQVLHVDFQGVKFGETITVQVPVVHVGQAIGLKEGGLLTQFIHKLDVECLPRQIPEKLEVDITDMKIGDTLHVRDLSFENVKILNPEDSIIFTIVPPKGAVVEEAEAEGEQEEESKEPEVISKGKSDKEE